MGEIETALRSLSGVKEAAVTVRKTADGEQELAAYVVHFRRRSASARHAEKLEREVPGDGAC
ncbi:hypothetical protein P9257_18680 [Bacillus velezensis]|nr:hypothetical protein [Bacillus velezensis]